MSCSGCETGSCTCCQGVQAITPVEIFNRPGLEQLQYRVGTQARFFETMQARLSSTTLEVEDGLDADNTPTRQHTYPLAGLTTRERSDPAIAMLDAWAMVGDVLSFYNERIANEGYLRTASERRSVLELARLVGYAPRPGVSASVFLAYELEVGHDDVRLPKSTRAQSIPGPGELPQSFETSEDLIAQAKLSAIKPRMMRPQFITFRQLEQSKSAGLGLNLKGNASGLRAGDRVLLSFTDTNRALYHVLNVTFEGNLNRTSLELARVGQAFRIPSQAAATVSLEALNSVAAAMKVKKKAEPLRARVGQLLNNPTVMASDVHKTLGELSSLGASAKTLGQTNLEQLIAAAASTINQTATISFAPRILAPLLLPPSEQPTSSLRLERSTQQLYDPLSDLTPKLFAAFFPRVKESAYAALEAAPISDASGLSSIEAVRIAAGLFGSNAPLIPVFATDGNGRLVAGSTKLDDPPGFGNEYDAELKNMSPNDKALFLDGIYDQIKPGGQIVLVRVVDSKYEIETRTVVATDIVSPRKYGLTNKITVLTLETPWKPNTRFGVVVQSTTVFAVAERLELADESITDLVYRTDDSELELDGLYRGLESGRWVIVQGERMFEVGGAFVPSGVKVAELVMIASVRHDVSKVLDGKQNRPGDTLHTFVRFAKPLEWRFKRDTVTIFANVVKATHGETRPEVLGAGDASKSFQRFELKQPPLTYTAASTASGAASTLTVRVDGIQWLEAAHLAGLGANDRRFTVQIEDDGKTGVIFGDGVQGARLPTGRENITATYRSGIGKPGNVAAERITLLTSRPLGVKGVINPIRASGGANRETRDQARANAPLAVMALDRLVSVQDFEDFARTFAGIGKASASRFALGRKAVVHVTVAGADDIPIDTSSDLYRNLLEAFRRQGDPDLALELRPREPLLLVISARVRVRPEYRFDLLEPKIRAVMLERFGFEARALGQDVSVSEILSAIQSVPGVAYVDLGSETDNQGLGWVDETILTSFAQSDESSKGLEGLVQWLPATEDRIAVHFARLDDQKLAGQKLEAQKILPAQLAFLSPEVRDTLLLSEIT
jgi:hypothetical protein